jgi:hypothetical protein
MRRLVRDLNEQVWARLVALSRRNGNWKPLTVSAMPAHTIAFLCGLTVASDGVAKLVGQVEGRQVKRRVVIAGEHQNPINECWTDRTSYIAYSIGSLKACAMAGLSGMQTALALMVHEYLHDDDVPGSRRHDEGFYRRFHDVVCSRHGLAMPMRKALVGWCWGACEMGRRDLVDLLVLRDIGGVVTHRWAEDVLPEEINEIDRIRQIAADYRDAVLRARRPRSQGGAYRL